MLWILGYNIMQSVSGYKHFGATPCFFLDMKAKSLIFTTMKAQNFNCKINSKVSTMFTQVSILTTMTAGSHRCFVTILVIVEYMFLLQVRYHHTKDWVGECGLLTSSQRRLQAKSTEENWENRLACYLKLIFPFNHEAGTSKFCSDFISSISNVVYNMY